MFTIKQCVIFLDRGLNPPACITKTLQASRYKLRIDLEISQIDPDITALNKMLFEVWSCFAIKEPL